MSPTIVNVQFFYQEDLASNKMLFEARAEKLGGKMDHETTRHDQQHRAMIYDQMYYFDKLWDAVWFVAQLTGNFDSIIWIGFQGGTGL